MTPEPPAEPGCLERFIQAYQKCAKELEQARRSVNQRRARLFRAMLDEFDKSDSDPYLIRDTEQKKARDQFAIDHDQEKLDAAVSKAEENMGLARQARYTKREQAIAEWGKIYGASQTAEFEAFESACERLFAVFKDALESAVVAATACAATVLPDYQTGALQADALMPTSVAAVNSDAE